MLYLVVLPLAAHADPARPYGLTREVPFPSSASMSASSAFVDVDFLRFEGRR